MGGEEIKRTVVVITGPTGAGKSGLGIVISSRYNGEIISADSAQIYRGLDIGTAKPSKADRKTIRHHMIDVIDPSQSYDVGRFIRDATAAIATIDQRGRLPVLVGGTGMYLRALLYGLVEIPPMDPEIRKVLKERFEQVGGPRLHEELVRLDKEAAGRIHPNDGLRIIRALEVVHATGKALSAWQREHDIKHRQGYYNAVQVVISPSREALYQRIDQRVEEMLEMGWIEEVRGLLADGVDPRAKGMGVMGYRHVVDFVLGTGEVSRGEDTLKALIQRDHRRYAKRQLTWLRRQKELKWCANPREAREYLSGMLSRS